MKKIICSLILYLSFFTVFSKAAFEAGIGSGYIFYGDEKIEKVLDSFNQKSQIIFCADFSMKIPLAPIVYLDFGFDSIFDGRWKGGSHIYLWDYCTFAGFDIYPGLAGLYASVQYCFGRRTDFISLQDTEDKISNTNWGNGFAFGLAYDFGFEKSEGYSPEVGLSIRHMPRGGSSDNIFEVKLKLKHQ